MKDLAHEAGRAVSVSSPANSTIMLTVNGVAKQLAVAPWITLLDLLRERLDLTGTKKRCDHG
jgi:xanthine dehydrogenase YagT iron-sulfur-binding subunit